jgi:uncharacterized protein YndB with AHSA1/START domain
VDDAFEALAENNVGERRVNQPVTHIYEVYIRTTPEKLWEALTDGAMTKQYLFGGTLEPGPLERGKPMRYRLDDGTLLADGEVIELEPRRKIVQTWRGMPNADDPLSRVTWEITPLGEWCKLAVIHEHPDASTKSAKGTQDGWPIVLAGLKTLLETGVPFVTEQHDDVLASASRC